MYQMIRCGAGFDPVILVSPPGAGPDTEGAQFFRCASWQIHEHPPDRVVEISREVACGYFSGHADGLGFEIPPAEPFSTEEAILQFVIEKRTAWTKEHLEKLSSARTAQV